MNTQLPQGPQSDSYKIYLSVNVIDDTEGLTFYQIESPIIVTPNNDLASSISNSMLTNDPSSQIVSQMNSHNLNLVSKSVISMSTVLNVESSGTNSSSSANEQTATLRGYMAEKMSDISVSDVSSIKVISSTLSVLTKTLQQVSSSTAVYIYSFNKIYRVTSKYLD